MAPHLRLASIALLELTLKPSLNLHPLPSPCMALQERIDILQRAESQHRLVGADSGDGTQIVADMVALVDAAVGGPSRPQWDHQPVYSNNGLSVKPC